MASTTSAPPTSFGTLSSTDVDSVDWDRVVIDEPRNVSLWLLYLHRSEHPAVHGLLAAFLSQLLQQPDGASHPQEWEAYTCTRLPTLLMDIACEPDMFSLDSDAFKNLVYGSRILFVLGRCLNLLRIRRGDGGSFEGVPECAASIFSKRQQFFSCLWEQRHLVTQHSVGDQLSGDAPVLAATEFSRCAAWCIIEVLHIGDDVTEKKTPLTFRAAHFLLYYWTYSARQCVPDVLERIVKLFRGDKNNGKAFTRDFTANCPADYSRDFLVKIRLSLRSQITGLDAFYLNYIISALLITNDAPYIVGFPSEVCKLVPALIIFCHRQLCMSPGTNEMNFTAPMLGILQALIDSRDSRSIGDCIWECAGSLNIISIIARCMIGAVEEGETRLYEPAIFILAFLSARASRQKPLTRPHYFLQLSTERIWHDTLRTMLAISTLNMHQSVMKRSIVSAWRAHGARFGLQDGINVSSVNAASVPSNTRWYLQIRKQCFWGPCGCASLDEAPHRFRVCRGCWRVLYCNERCQEADWKAGHRLVCQPFANA